MRLHRKAFTFNEILITVLIISVLVTLGAAKMNSIKKKAILQEALTAMSAIRSVEDKYMLDYEYFVELDTLALAENQNTYLRKSDLDGNYFSYNCYYIWNISDGKGGFHLVTACAPKGSFSGRTNTAKNADWVKGWKEGYIAVDDKGNIYSTINGLGYPRPPDWIMIEIKNFGQ